MLHRTEIHIVAVSFPGRQGMQGMMEVVTPHRIEAEPAQCRRGNEPGIVQVAFGDEIAGALQHLRQGLHPFRQLQEKRSGRPVTDGMDGIQAEAVAVIVFKPMTRVFEEEIPDLIALRPVEIDGIPPRRPVAIGEIGAIIPEVVAFRPQMVVDHIQDNRQARLVTGIDQALERRRSPVRILHREREDAVVSPVAGPGELSHRHELDGIHAKCFQVRKARDDGIERPVGGKGTHMEFIDDHLGKVQALPCLVPPFEAVMVHDLGWTVDITGLEMGSRVRAVEIAIEGVKVLGLFRQVGNNGLPVAVMSLLHEHPARCR